jgi:hypothetical protein
VISATSLPTEEELSDFYSKTYFQDSVATTYQQDYSDSELVHKRLLADQIIYGIADNQRTNITIFARMGVAVQVNFDPGSLAKSAADILNDSNETACTLPDIDCAGQEQIVEKVL